VVTQETRPDYGNMIEIDHGKDLITRYAHSSKVFVKKGDLIKRGQKIAEVGTTGRSTGPHLHFEVLVRGVPQDPQKFLAAGRSKPAQQVALARVQTPLPAAPVPKSPAIAPAAPGPKSTSPSAPVDIAGKATEPDPAPAVTTAAQPAVQR